MAEETKITLEDCLAGAFQALLRGDTKSRDTLCAMAEKAFSVTGQTSLPGDTVIQINRPTDEQP